MPSLLLLTLWAHAPLLDAPLQAKVDAKLKEITAWATGAGFAVVADEVRSPAQRAAASARASGESADAALAESDRGAALSHRVAEDLGGLLTRFQEVDQLVVRIAEASHQQSESIHQLDKAFGSMQDAAAHSAASAEESAAAAVSLDAEADKLDGIVEEVRQLVGAGGTPAAPSASKPASQTAAPLTSPGPRPNPPAHHPSPTARSPASSSRSSKVTAAASIEHAPRRCPERPRSRAGGKVRWSARLIRELSSR